MNILKTIIVDDAGPVRAELKQLLKEYPEINVIGEAPDIDEAVVLINELNPDVIFLDIQLKGETGFDLFDKVKVNSKVIFITAYDQYAIRAFEVNALDYLLKPIKKTRLSRAVKKLLPNELNKTNDPQTIAKYEDVIYVMIDGSLKFIEVQSIKYIITEGKYSYIYYHNNKKELVSKSLLDWESILPEKYFVRIHRSTIINFEYVEKIHKCKNYTQEVYLKDVDEPFVISRRYAMKLRERFYL